MYSNSLSHHGVKGMKWGVRRYQDKNGRLTRAGREKYAADKKQRSDTDDENTTKRKGLTDKQKKAIKIGAAVVTTALVAYGGYKLYKSGKLDSLIESGKRIVENRDTNGIKKLRKPESLAETLAKVNPLRNNPEGANNCTICGMGTFLRQNGKDVTAKGTGGKMQNMVGMVEECFKFIDESDRRSRVLEGSAVKFGRSSNDAAEMLVKKFGRNAEGLCGVQWRGRDSGHTFNWKITDGVVEFFDGQNGNSHSSISKNYFRNIDVNGLLQIARLDGLKINPEGIKKYFNL